MVFSTALFLVCHCSVALQTDSTKHEDATLRGGSVLGEANEGRWTDVTDSEAHSSSPIRGEEEIIPPLPLVPSPQQLSI